MSRMTRWIAVIGLLSAQLGVVGTARGANVTDIGPPTATTPIGTFGGVAYVQYDGIVEGETSTGTYRVPYRITASTDTAQGNHTVVVEPPHFAQGLGSLAIYFRPEFLLGRGFSHAGVGYSTSGGGKRILDPSVPGVFINGGTAGHKGRTDDEIIVDFAKALASDPQAVAMVGPVERRYTTGFSEAAATVLRILASGRASGVFDLAIPFTADDGDIREDVQNLLVTGRFTGKLIIVDSEYEPSKGFNDRGVRPQQYRLYVVSGTPHVPDPLTPFFSNRTTPATYVPALRAHFLQGHSWVTSGTAPVPSTSFPTSAKRADAVGNALTVNASGALVPRLPYVDLGEARYDVNFTGKISKVRTIAQLGFASHDAYLDAFADEVADYVAAGYALEEDGNTMLMRAASCPPPTFTEVYRDHYEDFVAGTACSG